MQPNTVRQQVFLSFAGNNRETAVRLKQDLVGRGIDAFVDEQDIDAGANIVLAINGALARSDYYVLLWSQASVDRPYVDAEWSAAFAMEIRKRRSFLFVVRLDATPLPALLEARRYFDAFAGWTKVVDALAASWSQDRAVGLPVLPAPNRTGARHAGGGGSSEGSSIVLYVRNLALSVVHVLAVPASSTGQELDHLVRTGLALPDRTTEFAGAVGMRFHYRIMFDGKPIPHDTLAALHLTDGATVDLEVAMERFGPDGSLPPVSFRGGESLGLSPVLTRALVTSAFGHLVP